MISFQKKGLAFYMKKEYFNKKQIHLQ